MVLLTCKSERRLCHLLIELGSSCSKLEERIEAVTEISSDTSNRVGNMKNLIKGLPDLPRGLVRIQSGRVSIRCAVRSESKTFVPDSDFL